MIHVIPHEVSEGLRQENEVHRKAAAHWSPEQIRGEHPTAEAFLQHFVMADGGRQLAEVVKDLKPAARVLDIGAGYGRPTIFLASRGFRVSAAEPSPDLCRYLETLAQIYQLPLDIYTVPGEHIDRLPVSEFDACFFNASLHHCDDPLRALCNCRQLLAPGGRLFLLNEPLLQAFRSKAWFERQHTQGTLMTGDYGGNEHIYYRHEYLELLRQAGFGDIREYLSPRYRNPGQYFRYFQAVGVPRSAIWRRSLWYGAIRLLMNSGPPGRAGLHLLSRLSLMQLYFTATRQPDVARGPLRKSA